MGYNLYIGEAEVWECLEERRAGVCVAVKSDENAPINSTDDNTNRIFPGYGAFADFCRDFGIHDIFYQSEDYKKCRWWTDPEGVGHDCLLSIHPGAQPLTESHYIAFKEAQERHAGSCSDDGYNLKRINWLVWWTRWALDNCKYPTFSNT